MLPVNMIIHGRKCSIVNNSCHSGNGSGSSSSRRRPSRRAAGVSVRQSTVLRANAAAAAADNSVFDQLLRWADADADDTPLAVRVEQHPQYGRCLVAAEDVPATGSVLLSVPIDRVFASQPAGELEIHWAAEMALRLLQARHASQHQQHHQHDSVDWGPWIASLPERVATPVEFTTSEIEQLVLPGVVQVGMKRRVVCACWSQGGGSTGGAVCRENDDECQTSCHPPRVTHVCHTGCA